MHHHPSPRTERVHFSSLLILNLTTCLPLPKQRHPVRSLLEEFASISYWFSSLFLRKCYTKPNSSYTESRVKLHQLTTSPVTTKLHDKLLNLTIICSMVLVGKWLPYLASYHTMYNIHLKEYTQSKTSSFWFTAILCFSIVGKGTGDLSSAILGTGCLTMKLWARPQVTIRPQRWSSHNWQQWSCRIGVRV